ncbi:methyltransferase family protein [Chachezhania sediminis]|uniref:methyltransferase family protein n=1 Tax=Chachezhania sediminis TaxID=2599291 RepID=UPI00131D4736|nr:methyltransferase [Chachezhania sediminis]
MAELRGPDILVYPPLLAAGAIVVVAALHWLAPLHVLPPFGRPLLLIPGLLVLALSGWLGVAGVLAFRAAGTNVNPHKPALVLVRAGPYRFTRNPMYLGIVLLLVGLGLALSLDWALPMAAVVWALLHFGVVLREEAYLTELWGTPYTDYLKDTRRWV